MDVLKYLNSRDVAEYLESIDFEFNAMQAAYIIYINEGLPMEERLRLWKEIIDTMPDCGFRCLQGECIYMEPSAHAAIRKHIGLIEEVLSALRSSKFDEEEIVYIPRTSRWGCPEWCKALSGECEAMGGVLWYPHGLGGMFKSFEKSVRWLKDNLDECGDLEPARPSGSFERFRIRLRYLDSDFANCHSENHDSKLSHLRLAEVALNGDLEVIGFEMGWVPEDFECFVPEIPHPFESGDILINAAGYTALPFVFDRCVTWTLEVGSDEYCDGAAFAVAKDDAGDALEIPLVRYDINIDEFSEAIDQRAKLGFWDILSYAQGHMSAFGYMINGGGSQPILEYDGFGACGNYLNLEYYKGPLEGRLSVLPTVSWFVMNENREPLSFEARYKKEEKAVEKFRSRDIEIPDAASYDICSLVNEGFQLG